MSITRLFPLLLVTVLLAACGPDDDGGFEPFDPQGTHPVQVCVNDQLGVGGAEVTADYFDGEPAGSWVTDGEGWFELDESLDLVGHEGITFEARRGRYAVEFELVSVDIDAESMADWGPFCVDPEAARRAVVESSHDVADQTLDSMNFPATRMDYSTGDNDTDYVTTLRFPNLLAEYDVMVFPSGMDEGWYEFADEVIPNLQDWVADGGSLYVSDQAYTLVELLDPDAIDFAGDDDEWKAALVGNHGEMPGRVVDPVLADALDGVPEPLFTMGSPDEGWAMIDGVRDDLQVMAEAQTGMPLTVIWTPFEGGGQVVFSSLANLGSPNGETWRVLVEAMLRM